MKNEEWLELIYWMLSEYDWMSKDQNKEEFLSELLVRVKELENENNS